ncbi:MAG: DUF6152 family protein [Woeseiaceae bacterium]
MRTRILLATMLAGLLGFSAVNAHHSFAATFQEGSEIAVEGVVTNFSFKNPHILIYLDVTDESGAVTNWMSEGGAATLMRNAGWSRDTFKPGDHVRISGNPTHDGSPMISVGTVQILDAATGEVVRTVSRDRDRDGPTEIVEIPLLLEDGRPNLTGAWVQLRRPGERRRPTDLGGPPPYSAAGAAAQAEYDRSNDPQIFCEPPGVVRQAGFTPHPLRISQETDHIIFEYEEFGGYRIVPLSDELPAAGPKSKLGDSIAHYDGDTLVVRTVNILSNPSNPLGHQTSDQVTTVETYKRVDEAEFGPLISTKMVITDPVYYDGGSWTLEQTKRYSEGYEFIENDCRPPLRERVEQAAKVVAEPVPPIPPLEPEEEEGPGMLESLETSSLATWVAESLYGYPIVLGLHAIGLAIVVGLLVFVDLRLMNMLGDIRPSALLGPMKLAWYGFFVNALSGFALFSSQATYIIYSKPFLIKIGLVFLGAILAFHIQRQVRKNMDSWAAGPLPASIKGAAAVSLLCWMGAIIAGRLIAYL